MIAAYWVQWTVLASAASFLRMSNIPDTISGTHHPNKGVRVRDAGIEVSKNLPNLDSWSLESEWVVSEEALSAQRRSASAWQQPKGSDGPRNRCQGYSLLHAIVLAPLFGERKKKKKVL
jgi:hypothetical protein